MDPQAPNVEYWKLAVTAGVSLIVGAVTVAIQMRQAATASEQKRIAAAKLNLDLFEERYAVFAEVKAFLDDHLRGPVPFDPKYQTTMQKAHFLFGPDIANYIGETIKHHFDLETVRDKTRRQNNIPYPEDSDVFRDEQLWFHNEARDCYKRFAPYLDFSNWKAQE